MEFRDTEKNGERESGKEPQGPSTTPTPPGGVVDTASSIAGQNPTVSHSVNQPDEAPLSGQSSSSPTGPRDQGTSSDRDTQDTPDTDPEPDGDPEAALARVTTAPLYSVFSVGMKRWIIAIVTMTSFLSPMTANIYFPALNPIAADLGVSVSLINLTLTTYMIFQGIAPTLFGDFGDMAGRRPAFILAVSIYVVANIGLALQDNYAALMVLRMVQSGGSSGTLALGYAVVADITTSAERGKYMGIVGAGINVGPALSPVIGGLLAQYLGWRAIFWFCFIFSCCVLIPYTLTVPETCRAIVGNGSIPPRGWNLTLTDLLRARKSKSNNNTITTTTDGDQQEQEQTLTPQRPKLRFPNPLRALALAFDKGVGLIIFYNSLLYLVFIITVSTLSTQFKTIYGYNDLQIGLCYMPYGAGCFAAAIGQGYLLDWNYRRIAQQTTGFTVDKKRGDDLSNFPIERARIGPLYFFVTIGLVAMILYGWILELRPSVAAPLCLQFCIGLCITGSFGILNTLIVDLSPEAPATAVAANNFVRCEMGAAATAVIELMIGAMGTGWCFTFFALLAAVFAPILWAEARFGIQWRAEKRASRERRRVDKEEKREKKEKERVEEGGKGSGKWWNMRSRKNSDSANTSEREGDEVAALGNKEDKGSVRVNPQQGEQRQDGGEVRKASSSS